MQTNARPITVQRDAWSTVLTSGPWEFRYSCIESEGLFYAIRDAAQEGDPSHIWQARHGEGWPALGDTRECLLYGIGLWLAAREA